MTTLLALDTSTEYLSVALWHDNALISRECLANQKHSDLTLPYCQELLAEASLAMNQLDGIVLSIGPGAFTGVRIGCGITQGLAFALDIPVLPCNSLLAMAETHAQQHGASEVITMLDARIQQLYYAHYQIDKNDTLGWRTITAPCLLDATAASLPQIPYPVAITGTALIAYPDIHAAMQQGSTSPIQYPHAIGLAHLGARLYAAGKGIQADQIELLYLRDKVAQTTAERNALS